MTELLTVDQVGKALKVGRKTVYGLIKKHELRAVRIGKQYRVELAALREYIDTLRREAEGCREVPLEAEGKASGGASGDVDGQS